MGYRGIIFDVDGVLSDSAEDFGWIDEFYKKEFPEPGKTEFDNWDDYLEQFGDAFRGLSSENGEEILEDLPVSKKDLIESYRALQKRKYEIMSRFTAYEDVRDILELLDQQGYQIAAVSNSSQENTEKFLDKEAILDYFDFVRGVDLESFEKFRDEKKPNAMMVEEALDSMEMTPDEVLMVGDSSTDEGAAVNAGVDFVKLERGEGNASQEVERKIESLDELKKFL